MSHKHVLACYVEKKPGFDVQARAHMAAMNRLLAREAISALRIFQRYVFQGLSAEDFARLRDEVLADLAVDQVFDQLPELASDAWLLGVQSLPGQYDARADWAEQAAAMVSLGARPRCRAARFYAYQGRLTAEEQARIRAELINPVDACEASRALPEGLETPPVLVEEIPSLEGFRALDGEGLLALADALGMSLDLADLQMIQAEFQGLGRDPLETELKVLDTYWSDHCRHSTFLSEITGLSYEKARPGQAAMQALLERSKAQYDDDTKRLAELTGKPAKPLTLMQMASQAAKLLQAEGAGDDIDVSAEVNACTLKRSAQFASGSEDIYLLFKNETHNHPTEIEPYGGAATCLGGAIRDPLSGRAYVYQGMRVTGSANPLLAEEDLPEGKLPSRLICQRAADGFASYGNQIGVPSGHVQELYHQGYRAKRLECGAVLAAAPVGQVQRAVPEAGDLIVLLGGRTGRDGVGGASGSSRAHDRASLERSGAEVQKGDPVCERKLQRFFQDPDMSRLVKRCNDFGAGGISVAVGELADSLDIDLGAILCKYDGLDATELALSESQERMALCIAAKDWPLIEAGAAKENLEASVVAQVTDTGQLRMDFQGQRVVDFSRAFLDRHGAAREVRCHLALPELERLAEVLDGGQASKDKAFEAAALEDLTDLHKALQVGLQEQFDATVGGHNILMPYGGRLGLSPEMGLASLIPLKGRVGAKTASLMSLGQALDLAELSPYHAAYLAVFQSLLKLLAMGQAPFAARLSFQEYFERMDSPKAYGKVYASLLGAYQAQRDFAVAAIGGKDSMSGSYESLSVPPTFLSFAVDTLPAERVISATLPELGLSLYVLEFPRTAELLPAAKEAMALFAAYQDLLEQGKIRAAFVPGRKGLLAASAQAAMGAYLGLDFAEDFTLQDLRKPAYQSLVFALDSQLDASSLFPGALRLLAQVTEAPVLRHGQASLPMERAIEASLEVFDGLYPRAKGRAAQAALPKEEAFQARVIDLGQKRQDAPPKVLIAVFPGSNCEDDLGRAFSKAGGKVEYCLFRNLSEAASRDSIEALARSMDQAQILVLPGGFSAGDEPDGSAKFIAAVFRHQRLRKATEDFLGRKGLILGICNGFQALLKLGLLPYGKITDPSKLEASLTVNADARHLSRYLRCQTLPNDSPWFAHTAPGSCSMLPASHGEGRFICPPEMLERLEKGRQVACRYVQDDTPLENFCASNPNGSMGEVEALLSPCGQILGKMAHSERTGEFVAMNIPDTGGQEIFEAAIAYWRA